MSFRSLPFARGRATARRIDPDHAARAGTPWHAPGATAPLSNTKETPVQTRAKHVTIAASVLWPLLGIFACSGAASSDEVESPFEEARSSLARDAQPAASEDSKEQLAAGQAQLTVDLLQTGAAPDANVIQSPHSLATCLAMVYAGALGDTKAEMAGALSFTLPDDQLHTTLNWQNLALASRSSGRTRLALENQLFADEDVTFLPKFLDTLAVHYGAGVNLVDFGDGSTKDRINTWIAERTEQRIPIALERLEPKSVFALVNTIYLQSPWSSPFSADRTRSGTFAATTGSKTVSFMQETSRRAYLASETAQTVELALGNGLVLDVVIPTGELGPFEATLTGATLRALWPTESESIDLRLPKLTIRPAAGGSLKETLQRLGMQRAFDDAQAELGGMVSSTRVYLDQVVQKTYLAIDEEGLEAAAATVAVGADAGAAVPTTPRVVSVDKPFLLVVRDPATQAILFSGHVVDPTL